MKVFWNLSWYGGGPSNLTESTSSVFSAKLQLTERDVNLAKASFIDVTLENLQSQVRLTKLDRFSSNRLTESRFSIAMTYFVLVFLSKLLFIKE